MQANDKNAIAELLSRAAYALDNKDLDTLQAGFAEDARFTLLISGGGDATVFEGREAIMGLMSGALEAQTDVRKHVISNIWYEHEGDTAATVVSYLTLMATENGATRLITTGIYRDGLIKTSDGWLLNDRHLHLDTAY